MPIAYWISEAGGLVVSGVDLGGPRGPMPPSKVFLLSYEYVAVSMKVCLIINYYRASELATSTIIIVII